jgi:hypothetical protein
MALPLALPIGPVAAQSGPQSTPYTTPYGGLAVSEFGGRWTELTRLGYMWTYSTAAAGVNIPIYTSTTQQFVLSNPSGSGVSLLLKSWVAGYVSGAPVVGNFVICGANVTSATAPSGTAGLQFNNSTGAIIGNKVSCLGSTVTVVAATWFRPSMSVFTTTSGNSPVLMGEDLDGSIIVRPGGWVGLAANAATFGTMFLAFQGAEIPVSTGF